MLPLVCNEEVTRARTEGRPLVALETSVLSQGLPQPTNIDTARAMEQAVREAGAVPATTALHNGAIHIGLDEDQLAYFGKGENIAKAGARDIGPLLATGQAGATTVSATLRCAGLAGIPIMATGGIGGVHRGAAESFDISADLPSIAATPVAVVCSGAKSILDLPKTLEVLETVGVPVVGYGTDQFPAFHARQSGLALDWRVDTPDEAAAMLATHRETMTGGLVVAHPVPAANAIAPEKIEQWVEDALARAAYKGVIGKAVTPFLLSAIAEASGGETLKANVALLCANARLAGEIAVALAARGDAQS